MLVKTLGVLILKNEKGSVKWNKVNSLHLSDETFYSTNSVENINIF